ncbi:MAG: pyrroline-5-carboxylate reductase [Sebaldella sp.]|nr:pyrroline-5-carboxylate reductase [Sebaldella sp.]
MKIGFIGTGNMGKAIIEGFISSKNVKSEDIFVFDIDSKKLEILADEFKVNTTTDENEAVKSSDLIILAVKPNIYDIILEKIKNSIDNNKIILTIAAGFSIERAEKIIGSNKKIIRTMPNTPAQVLEGMTGIVFNKNITNEEKDTVIKLLSSFGGVEEIDEKLMHVFSAISGSMPALVDIFIEALADGAVLNGMPRDKAYKILSEAVAGSAHMIKKLNKHPGVLKDEVCSPGGTTIEAVAVLEKGAFRSTLIEAVTKCTEKSIKLSEK